MTVLKDPLYADSSALVKLVVNENESESFAEYLNDSDLQLTSSVLCEVEMLRAVSRTEPILLVEARRLLDGMILLPLTSGMRRRAAGIKPSSVRSLDAIHLATALEIQADLHALVSYDNRLLEAAGSAGIESISPGA